MDEDLRRKAKAARAMERYWSDPEYRERLLAYQKAHRDARYGTDEAYTEKRRAKRREYNRTHPKVVRAAVDRYKIAHPDRVKANDRRSKMKSAYGLTIAEYDVLLTAQGGSCALCDGQQLNPRRKYLAVDHDHVTGRVRGLLCDRCNTGIANFDDSPERLHRAIAYLGG